VIAVLKPSIGRRAFIPNGLLTPSQVREAKRSLVFKERREDAVTRISEADDNTDLSTVVDQADDPWIQFSSTEDGSSTEVTVNEYREGYGGVSLPRAWAMGKYPHLNWVDRTVFPIHKVRDKADIQPRDERQALFFQRLVSAASDPGPQDILANATTGSGKTVAGIYLGWQLRTPTLIVVDRNRIADGWLKNFRQFFGQGWTDKNVGRVQASTIDYKGKAFVITLAQSLARRKYQTDFYRHFGLIVIDEVQVFGGPHFCPILHMFPSRVRAYFTAENRSGEFGKRIKAHTGNTRVTSNQEVLKPNAWIIKNTLPYIFYARNDGALLTNLSRVESRNERLANLIEARGWQRDRNVLVLSNRTAQLLHLKNLLVAKGVPEEHVGIHVGSYLTNRYVLYYTLPGSTKRNRIGVYENANEARNTLRSIKRKNWTDAGPLPAALINHIETGVELGYSTERENFKPSQADLDNITHFCKIILATYEIFAKGVDVPRLDMGVEALPSGNVKQPLGRVLRILDGKLTPEWYAVHDTFDPETEAYDELDLAKPNSQILIKYFGAKTKARINALKKAGAKVKFS
jgi:superfamily II DNA or RNA helicase